MITVSGITEEHRWVPDPPSLSFHNFERRPCPMCSSKVDPRVLASVDDRETPATTSPDSTRRPSAPDPVSGRFIGSESSKRRLYSVPAEVCSVVPPRSSPSSCCRAPDTRPARNPAFVVYGGPRDRHHHHLDRSALFDPDLFADGPVSLRPPIPIPPDPDYCDALGGVVDQASFSADPIPIPPDRRFDSSFDFQPRSRSRHRPPPSSSFFKVAAPTALERTLARSSNSIHLLSPSRPIPVTRDPRLGSPCAQRRGPPRDPDPPALPSTSARSFEEAFDQRRPRTPKFLPRGPLSTTITRQLAKSERDLTQSMSLSSATIGMNTWSFAVRF